MRVRREFGMSCRFISHNLRTLRSVCDEIVVIHRGRKPAQVARADFQCDPHHPCHDLLAR